MKTLLILLSLTMYLLKTTDASANSCRPNPKCETGQECYDSQNGEMYCKVKENSPYRTITVCQSQDHTVTIELQELMFHAANFTDRVVVRNNSTIPEYFQIAVGFPTADSRVVAGNGRHALELVPLFGQQTHSLKIGDRNLGKAFTFSMLCNSAD